MKKTYVKPDVIQIENDSQKGEKICNSEAFGCHLVTNNDDDN